VERVNGVLKGRWRCLLSDRTLHYNPVKVGMIVNACAVLHIFCQEWRLPYQRLIQMDNDPDVEGWIDEEDDFEDIQQWRRLAEEERQFLIQHANT